MAKQMRALVREATDAGSRQRRPGDHRNSSRRGEADVWGEIAKKHSTTIGCRATILQIGRNGGTDIRWQRHLCLLSPLAVDQHLPRSPIDVVEGQGGDLVCPQSEAREQDHDRVVSSSDRSSPIATVKDLLDLFGRQIGWKCRKSPVPDGRHTIREIERNQTFAEQISEKGAEGPTHGLGGCRAPILRMALDIACYVGPAELRKIPQTTDAGLSQKATNHGQMTTDRDRYEAALS